MQKARSTLADFSTTVSLRVQYEPRLKITWSAKGCFTPDRFCDLEGTAWVSAGEQPNVAWSGIF